MLNQYNLFIHKIGHTEPAKKKKCSNMLHEEITKDTTNNPSEQ